MATGRIGVTPTLRTRWSKQPTAGTTSLSGLDDNSVSLVYDVGYEAVYRNGVLLSRGNDYTATNGTTVTLIDATLAGDIIEILANQLVPLTDAISKGQFTAKGALLSATAASTPGVLTVGSNAQVLTADSTTSTGLKWAAAAGGLTFINKFEPSSVSTQAMNDIFSSTYKYYKIVWSVVMTDAAELQMRLRVSGSDATSNYNISQIRTTGASSSGASQETAIGAIPASFGATSGIKQGEMIVFNPFTATKTGIDYHHYSENASSGVCGALHTDSTSYTGCSFYPATGTITGEISVYGFNRS